MCWPNLRVVGLCFTERTPCCRWSTLSTFWGCVHRSSLLEPQGRTSFIATKPGSFLRKRQGFFSANLDLHLLSRRFQGQVRSFSLFSKDACSGSLKTVCHLLKLCSTLGLPERTIPKTGHYSGAWCFAFHSLTLKAFIFQPVSYRTEYLLEETSSDFFGSA